MQVSYNHHDQGEQSFVHCQSKSTVNKTFLNCHSLYTISSCISPMNNMIQTDLFCKQCCTFICVLKEIKTPHSLCEMLFRPLYHISTELADLKWNAQDFAAFPFSTSQSGCRAAALLFITFFRFIKIHNQHD